MSFRRAFLDLDGVLVNLVDRLAEVHEVPHRYETWPATYDLSVPLGKSQEAIWNHPRVQGSEFWATLPKHDWADDLVKMLLREFDGHVSFLSQTVRDPWCAAGKACWIKEHYPRVPFLLGTEKVAVAAPGFVIVDDYEVNIEKWQKAGGCGILFPAPWNRLRAHPDPVGLVERVLRERRREQEMI
jgi:hypothetical protein